MAPPEAELLIRGGVAVLPEGRAEIDLAVSGGRIVAMGEDLSPTAAEELDARGLHLFPGCIDVHVHFNEPGREHWEGLASGSAALAAGGGTLFLDMPLNSHPPLLDGRAFRAKQAAAETRAITDFALWGGLTPDSLDNLEELAGLGAIGFKAFMCDSGIPEFRTADDDTLREGMLRARALGLPVAVHAESEALVGELTRAIRASGGRTEADYLRSRPVAAEEGAVARAILLAEETGAELHIVHVSTPGGVELVRDARRRGVRVTCETCPHYLHFCDRDLLRRGAVLKCAPPLRSAAARAALWQHLRDGPAFLLIASDHSPATEERKRAEDFFDIWGGIGGVQGTLRALLSDPPDGGPPLRPEEVARFCSANPADRFGLVGKGRIALGNDADLTLLDLGTTAPVEAEELHDRQRRSPYLGRSLRGRVRRTLLRGRTIFADGSILAKGGGRLIRPGTERTTA